MTVVSETITSGPYYPNGATVTFPFGFEVADGSEVLVLIDDVSVNSSLYTVTVNDSGTGWVTFLTAPLTGTLYLTSDPEFDQQTSLKNQGPYYQVALERMVDRQAMRSLWLRERITRLFPSLLLTGTSPIGKFLSWGLDGLPTLSDGGGPAGPPGGNVMSIGPKATATALTIATGTDLVQTSGYLTSGDGGHARYVYDAAVDASYVTANPRSSFLSANARGFRLDEREVNVLQFGAVPDCTAIGGGTDNYAAFCAARDFHGLGGGIVRVPKGRYRLSQKVVCTTGVLWIGDRIGQNPGVIAGVAYPTTAPNFLYGSVIVCDTDTAGFQFLYHTDEVNQNTVAASIGSLGNASPYWQYPSAERGGLERLTLFSSNTGDTGKYGVETRSRISLRDLVIRGFGGNGVQVWGSTDGTHGTVPYGNVNFTIIHNVRSILNNGDGLKIEGRDANSIDITNFDAASNTGWGLNDEGLLSNHYKGGQAANNGLGSYRSTSAVAPNVYEGCYVETAGGGALAELTEYDIVINGQLASEICHAPTSNPMIVQGRSLTRAGWQWNNARGAEPVQNIMGINDTSMTVWCFGAEAVLDGYKLQYEDTSLVFNLRFAGSSAATPLQLPFNGTTDLRTTGNGGGYGPAFPGGFYFGGAGFGFGRKQHHNTGTAAPATGTWQQGDLIWNSAPAAAGTLGWVCTTAGTPGTWKAISGIAP